MVVAGERYIIGPTIERALFLLSEACGSVEIFQFWD